MDRGAVCAVVSILICLYSNNGLCQLKEDFSDGDITNNPTWTSSNISGVDDFVVDNGELQSNGPESTSKIWTSIAAVPNLSSSTVSWTFDARYLSPPSGSNNIKVFLMSSESDLSASPIGYFLQLGESGGGDGIDLMKTGSSTPLISDPEASISGGINNTIKVTRNSTGLWSLSAGENAAQLKNIGQAQDDQFIDQGFFGFLVSHTKSRHQDFYFDNIQIESIDMTPPRALSVTIGNENSITITFSEELQKPSAEDINHYRVNASTPISASLDTSQTMVELTLAKILVNGSENLVSIENLVDVSNNLSEVDSLSFTYFVVVPASFRDLIINEILADPEPQNDLPAAEFVEIFNRSSKIFDLGGWSFCDASGCEFLDSKLIFPDQYIILADTQDKDEFIAYNNVIFLEKWPTLNNSGDQLKLKDQNGVTIDSVHYSDRWFKSSSKREGGWSLELIDSENFCSDENNWIGSESLTGGSPGSVNSVKSNKPDLSAPYISEVYAIQPDSIIVLFNEALDQSSIEQVQYNIIPEITIDDFSYSNLTRSISLTASDSLTSGQEYTIELSNIVDCSGNRASGNNNTSNFTLLESPRPGDLVINELLFNPKPGGVDFIEIYNRSERHIDLAKAMIANFNLSESEIEFSSLKSISSDITVIKPNKLAVVTEDALILKEKYLSSDPEVFIEVSQLSPMPDDKGAIALLLEDTTVVDMFEYSEEFHIPSINDKEGVSLERISTEEATQNPGNWTSASSTVHYATPGIDNSQSKEIMPSGLNQVNINPEIINLAIPQQNLATISYSFSKSGSTANVVVYDIYGRVIKNLVENELLPSNGFLNWNGHDDLERKVRSGYYVVYFEALFSDGEILTFKKKVAVTNQF